MTNYVFAYGSLLSPTSLTRTLPGSRMDEIVGARLKGFTRTFDVAFPNDGSQGDKAYFDRDGERPTFILFANVVRSDERQGANGILVPVGQEELELLSNRERRYRLLTVTQWIRPIVPPERELGQVFTFVGRDRFTRPGDVAKGVLSREYLATIMTGVHYWQRTYPGFEQDYHATTRRDPTTAILDLVRIDPEQPETTQL